MRYKPSIAKLKGKNHSVRGNPTMYIGFEDIIEAKKKVNK